MGKNEYKTMGKKVFVYVIAMVLATIFLIIAYKYPEIKPIVLPWIALSMLFSGTIVICHFISYYYGNNGNKNQEREDVSSNKEFKQTQQSKVTPEELQQYQENEIKKEKFYYDNCISLTKKYLRYRHKPSILKGYSIDEKKLYRDLNYYLFKCCIYLEILFYAEYYNKEYGNDSYVKLVKKEMSAPELRIKMKKLIELIIKMDVNSNDKDETEYSSQDTESGHGSIATGDTAVCDSRQTDNDLPHAL